MLADGDVWQLADRTCDPVLTVIESVEVRQRSGQFAGVQIRNGVPWSDVLLPECQTNSPTVGQTYPGSDRGCAAAASPGVLRNLRQRAATPADSGVPARVARVWRNEPDRPGVEAAGPGASRSGGLSFFRWRATGRRVHRSIRALAVPPPLPDSANWWKQLAEPVPAPERLSTGAGSASCPRPGQGQDRNPTQ